MVQSVVWAVKGLVIIEQQMSSTLIVVYNRAGCAGMIISLSYCFHRAPSSVPIATKYVTTVAVYRPASGAADEEIFTVVSSPITIQESATDFLAQLNADADDFVCSELTLTQPVSVLAGDVLGACVFDPPSVTTYRLDIVIAAEAMKTLLEPLQTPAHLQVVILL